MDTSYMYNKYPYMSDLYIILKNMYAYMSDVYLIPKDMYAYMFYF